VIALLRALQSGEVAGSTLAPSDRRRVVENLWAEGYSAAETAEIVKVSERTVIRDRGAIRQANAVAPSPTFLPETVGMLLRQADLTVARLRRLSRDKATPAAAKVEAERSCWEVTRGLVSTLQTLGYLPSAPRQILAELTHRLEEPPSYPELQAELERVHTIVAAGGDTQIVERVKGIKDTVNRLALSDEIRALSTHSEPPSGDVHHDQT
jgi:hypothetical protein